MAICLLVLCNQVVHEVDCGHRMSSGSQSSSESPNASPKLNYILLLHRAKHGHDLHKLCCKDALCHCPTNQVKFAKADALDTSHSYYSGQQKVQP